MRLILIRHAQSANNALPECERVEDPAITEIGHEQARALADSLVSAKLTRIITSPFRRSLQTTHYVARRLRLVPEVWIDLHEQGGCYSGHEAGCYQGRPGMTRQQIAAEFPQYIVESTIDGQGWWKCQPYESEELARKRAQRLLRRTIATFGETNECIAYVMHGDFKRIFLNEMFSESALTWNSNGHSVVLYNTGVTQIVAREERFHVEALNDVEHLIAELRTA